VIDFIRKHSVNRITRIYEYTLPYYKYIEENGSKKVKESTNKIAKDFMKLRQKVYFFSVLRILGYLVISAATISGFFRGFEWIQKTLSTFTIVSSILGTFLIMGLISFCSRLINIWVSDAHMLSATIISSAISQGYVPVEGD